MDTIELNEKKKLVSHLGMAIMTTAKDVLLLVFKKRYPTYNRGVVPLDALKQTPQGRNVLRMNRAMENSIKNNIVEEFDVTTLCHLLRFTCGLKPTDKAWSNTNILEGNIKTVQKLRNDFAHWTEAKCSLQELKQSWTDLHLALKNILILDGFSGYLPKVEEELTSIRKGDTPHQLQEQMRKELMALYRDGHKTLLQPLVWAGPRFEFHHSVSNTYTPIKITTLRHGEVTEVDVNDMVSHGDDSRMWVVQGESGTGKTTLLRHLAASWAAKAPASSHTLSHFKYLLLLDLTAVARSTFTAKDVIQEILPKTYSDWKATTIIKELAKTGENVLFLVDAFDERYDVFKDAFKELLNNCQRATFLVTTRPHCTQAIVKLSDKECKVATTHGFGQKAAIDYVSKIFQMLGKEDSLKDFISVISPYEEILTIPQLLCWSCWLWFESGNEKFSSRSHVFASMTDFLLRKMCHIHGKRILSGELPFEGQKWLDLMAQLAFTLVQQDQISQNNTSTKIKALEEEANKLNLRPHVALSTLMQCDSIMTARGERLVFQFVHKSQACFLAAHYITQHLRDKKNARLTPHLKKVNRNQQRLVLLFLVGQLVGSQTDIPVQLSDDVATFAREFVSFFDITYYLELLEESDYSQNLGQALGKHMPVPAGEEPLYLPFNRSLHKQSLAGQLWLRPKELLRSKALQQILTQAIPARVWLRLCEGPHNDELSPVSGHKDTRGDPGIALRLLELAYDKRVLPELKLTDCKFVSNPIWPQSLWWLSLQRCDILSHVTLPSSLMRLHFSECNEIENMDFYECRTRSMCLELCAIAQKIELPQSLQRLTLSCCENAYRLSLPYNLKHLTFKGYNLPTLPHGLTSLNISLPTCKDPNSLVNKSEMLTEQVKGCAQMLSVLEHLIITDMFITPLTFLDFLMDIENTCPKCQLRLESYCCLDDDADDIRSVIKDTVNNSHLPSVTVIFRGEVIKSSSSLEDLLQSWQEI